MIIENKSTEIGDVLIVKSDIPFIGMITLLSFVDDISGETNNRFFNKQFKYSLDGINYTQLIPLTLQNIQSIQITDKDTFFIEYHYIRSGSDNTGDLFFNANKLNANIVTKETPNFNKSLFTPFLPSLNNICSISWSINVLEKLYRKGHIPDYIERNGDNPLTDDRDYIDFWRAITHYFALFVCLSRYFQNFRDDENILREYLIEKNIIINNNTNHNELLLIMNNTLSEYSKRGTIDIIRKEGYKLPGFYNMESVSSSLGDYNDTTQKEYDGEYLRLIQYVYNDEFIFNLNKNEHIGWCVNVSSPLYKGLYNRLNTNKFYYETFDILTDLNQLPLINQQFCSLFFDTSIKKNVIRISNINIPAISGLGKKDPNFFININPNISYELSCIVKQSADSQSFDFGVLVFDNNWAQINCTTINKNVKNNFLNNSNLNRINKYIQIRSLLFKHNSFPVYSLNTIYQIDDIVIDNNGLYYKAIKKNKNIVLTNTNYWEQLNAAQINNIAKSNLGLGDNLILPKNAKYLIPYIALNNSSGNNNSITIDVYQIRINPVSTNYSKGFIQTPNFLEIWCKNNNKDKSNDDIINLSKQYLFPFNVSLKQNFL